MNGILGRSLAGTLCASVALLAIFFDQPSTAQSRNAATPEQNSARQNGVDKMATRQKLQAQAKRIIDAEMAREKAGDCPDAKTDYDFNICFGREKELTEQDLKSYEGIIRQLTAPSQPEGETPETDAPGIAGPALTPKQLLQEFDRVEQSWQKYRETACTAAFHQFDGGTGGPSFELQCEMKLIRDHMRELKMIYGEDFL